MCLSQSYSKEYIGVQDRQVSAWWRLNLKRWPYWYTIVTYSYIHSTKYIIIMFYVIIAYLKYFIYSLYVFMFIGNKKWVFSRIIQKSRWQRYYNHELLHISYVFNVLSQGIEQNRGPQSPFLPFCGPWAMALPPELPLLSPPPQPAPWKNCLPWHWSLVPKGFGTTGIECSKSIWQFQSMQRCPSYWHMLLDLAFHWLLSLAVKTNTRVHHMLCPRF